MYVYDIMQFLNSSLYMYKLCVIRYESLSYHYDIQFVSKFLTFSQLAVKKVE